MMVTDQNISCKSRLVMIYLISKPDCWKVIPADISKQTGLGKTAVYSAINELIKARYLQRCRVRNEDGTFAETVTMRYEMPYEDDQIIDEIVKLKDGTYSIVYRRSDNCLMTPDSKGPEQLSEDCAAPEAAADAQIAEPALTDPKPETVPDPEPEAPVSARTVVSRIKVDFEAWIKIYPRKDDQKLAYYQYRSLRHSGITAEDLTLAAQHYALSTISTPAQFIRKAVNFLKFDSWKDYLTPPPAVAKKPEKPAFSNPHLDSRTLSKIKNNKGLSKSFYQSDADAAQRSLADCRAEAAAQIRAEHLYVHNDPDLINEIVELMAEIYAARSGILRVSGSNRPATVVAERFRQLNYQHIECVADRIRSCSNVKNTRNYMLTCLWNAPTTMSVHCWSVLNALEVKTDDKTPEIPALKPFIPSTSTATASVFESI